MSLKKRTPNKAKPALTGNVITGTSIQAGKKLNNSNIQELAEIVEITPELAEIYLDSQTKNRNVKNSHVQYLVAEIMSDKWDLTGEAIKFDFDGHLRDGQHRLTAILNCGRSVEMLIIGGLNPETIDIMDTGSQRTIADILEIDGHANSSMLATVLVHVMRLTECYYNKESGLPKSYPDNRTGRHYAEKHREEFSRMINKGLHLLKRVSDKSVVPTSIFLAALIYLSRKNAEKTEMFLTDLTKFSFDDNEPGAILYHWMQKCQDPAKKSVKCSTLDMLHGYVYAYNCYVTGKKCKETNLYYDSQKDFTKVYEV